MIREEQEECSVQVLLTSLTSVTYVALSFSALSNSDSKCCFSLLSCTANRITEQLNEKVHRNCESLDNRSGLKWIIQICSAKWSQIMSPERSKHKWIVNICIAIIYRFINSHTQRSLSEILFLIHKVFLKSFSKRFFYGNFGSLSRRPLVIRH